jgi:hypothetical protein
MPDTITFHVVPFLITFNLVKDCHEVLLDAKLSLEQAVAARTFDSSAVV